MQNNWNSYILLAGMQYGPATLENSLAVFYKAKHILTIRPNNPSPIYPKEMKTNSQKTYKQMLIAFLFITALN